MLLVGRSYDTCDMVISHVAFSVVSFADRCQVVHGGSTDVEEPARPAVTEEPPQIAETAGHTRMGMYYGLACLGPHLERTSH